MINNQTVEQISSFLDLEKICVRQVIEIICFPKNINDDFDKKVLEVEKQLRNISPLIDLKIIKEGVIINERQIELFESSGSDGSTQ